MKIILTEKQLLKLINEHEFNYHISRKRKIKDLKPYGSDSIIRMDFSRHTGHFGSGFYFSTYSCENFNDLYGNVDLDDGNFKEVEENLYRVDFDLYKNLFRVKNVKHGDALFLTLKLINQAFFLYMSESEDLSNYYLKIIKNAHELGLKIPKYRDFIKMLQKAKLDYTKMRNKETDSENDIRSMSTRIMEYNGFNGVNVSGIEIYDSRLHGSVIYDLSKQSSTPIKVKDIDYFCHNKSNILGHNLEVETDFLRGEKVNYLKILKLPKNQQILFIKRYKRFISSYIIDEFGDDLKKLYYRYLEQKLIKDLMLEEITVDDIMGMYRNGYIKIILNPNIKIENKTLLEYILTNTYRINSYEIKGFIDAIEQNLNRELTDNEKIALEDVKEDII